MTASSCLPSTEAGQNTPRKRSPCRPAASARRWLRNGTGQGDEIDPSTMPITRIVNSTIDGVEPRLTEVIDDLGALFRFGSCLLPGGGSRAPCEGAGRGLGTGAGMGEETHGARFILAQGSCMWNSCPEAVAAIRRAIEQVKSPFAIAALHVMTTLSGSVLLALAHAQGHLDADAAWNAAHVDEIFQERSLGPGSRGDGTTPATQGGFHAASKVYRLA